MALKGQYIRQCGGTGGLSTRCQPAPGVT